MNDVIIPVLKVTFFSILIPIIITAIQMQLCIPHYQIFIAAVSFLSTFCIVYTMGLNKKQKQEVIALIISRFRK